MVRAFSLSVALGFGLMAAAPADAADKVTWTFSLYGPPRAATVTFEHLAKVAKEKSGGNFIINLKYNEQLGEAKDFLDGGKAIARDGVIPLNTHGGQLSHGRTHGMGLIHEAVTQLRGEAGERQVADAKVAVASSGGLTPSGVILMRTAS